MLLIMKIIVLTLICFIIAEPINSQVLTDNLSSSKLNSSGFIEEYNLSGFQHSVQDTSNFSYDRNGFRVLGEFTIGNLLGITAGFFTGWLTHSLTLGPNQDIVESDWSTAAVLVGAAGHIIGTALGVFVVAKGGNKDLSFWGTLASAVIVGSMSYLALLLPDNDNYLFLIGPSIGAVLYANTIGYPLNDDTYVQNGSNPNDSINCRKRKYGQRFNNLSESYSSIIERNNIIKINLFKISF